MQAFCTAKEPWVQRWWQRPCAKRLPSRLRLQQRRAEVTAAWAHAAARARYRRCQTAGLGMPAVGGSPLLMTCRCWGQPPRPPLVPHVRPARRRSAWLALRRRYSPACGGRGLVMQAVRPLHAWWCRCRPCRRGAAPRCQPGRSSRWTCCSRCWRAAGGRPRTAQRNSSSSSTSVGCTRAWYHSPRAPQPSTFVPFCAHHVHS